MFASAHVAQLCVLHRLHGKHACSQKPMLGEDAVVDARLAAQPHCAEAAAVALCSARQVWAHRVASEADGPAVVRKLAVAHV